MASTSTRTTGKTTRATGNLTGLTSNSVIGMASKHMEPYRFSEEEAREVGMIPADTGVIILIILYFIEHEPTICRSKLEYYLLLLDRKCFEQTDVLLFSWYLKNGRIRNFKRFIEFMIRRKLISLKGYSFELTKAGHDLGIFFPELINIKYWMDKLLRDFHLKNAKQTAAEAVKTKPSQQYLDALDNVRKLLGL